MVGKLVVMAVTYTTEILDGLEDARCDTGWKVGCDGSDVHSDYFFQ